MISPTGLARCSLTARGPTGRDAGDPGFGGRSSGERRTGGHRTDSPEPRDRDHAVDDREGNDTAGWERFRKARGAGNRRGVRGRAWSRHTDAGTADLGHG